MFRLIVTRGSIRIAARAPAGPLLRRAPPCGGIISFDSNGHGRTNGRKSLLSTGSITYSGGHASVGQGGFYASSDRASGGEGEGVLDDDGDGQRKSVLAMAADVQKVASVMREAEVLESLLDREAREAGPPSSTSVVPTGRSIEVRANIKKLLTQPDLLHALDRLETEGGPVWGLSLSERDMIVEAREKVNQC